MSLTLAGIDTLFPIPLYRYRLDEPGLKAFNAMIKARG